MNFFLILCALFLSFSSYSNDQVKFTISGISSGGFMANQMATIYSSQFSGVGTVAGGFYYCAENYLPKKVEQDAQTIGTRNLFLFEPTSQILSDTLNPFVIFTGGDTHSWFRPQRGNPIYQSSVCMSTPDKTKLPTKYLKSNLDHDLIDSLDHVKGQRAFIYHGKVDSVLKVKMQEQLKKYYVSIGMPASNIETLTGIGSHNFPTARKDGTDCKKEVVPYVASCDLDLAGKMLAWIFDEEMIRREASRDHIYIVDQNAGKPAPVSVAQYGYLYASDKCLENPSSCKLHVALHGCKMSDSYDEDFQSQYQKQVANYGIVSMRSQKETFVFNGLPVIEEKKNNYGLLKFVVDSGYIEYAEANDLMILFPQTWISAENFPYNPKGCWDWFGWTGENYATKMGSEASWLMSFIQNISLNPKAHIMAVKPQFDLMEKNFPRH